MNERMEGKKQEQIEGRKNGCKGVRREGWMEGEMDVTVVPASFPVMAISGTFGMTILYLSLV